MTAGNFGSVPVTVAQRLPSGETVPLGVLKPGEVEQQVRFTSGAAALLEHVDGSQARLSLKISGDTALDMRYEGKP